MSNSEEDASVLGKRLRNGDGEPPSNSSKDARPPESIEDADSDEDIGPMPLSVDRAAVKKKRKGLSCIIPCSRRALRNTGCCL